MRKILNQKENMKKTSMTKILNQKKNRRRIHKKKKNI